MPKPSLTDVSVKFRLVTDTEKHRAIHVGSIHRIHRNHHSPEDSDGVSRHRPTSPTFYISHFQMITGFRLQSNWNILLKCVNCAEAYCAHCADNEFQLWTTLLLKTNFLVSKRNLLNSSFSWIAYRDSRRPTRDLCVSIFALCLLNTLSKMCLLARDTAKMLAGFFETQFMFEKLSK